MMLMPTPVVDGRTWRSLPRTARWFHYRVDGFRNAVVLAPLEHTASPTVRVEHSTPQTCCGESSLISPPQLPSQRRRLLIPQPGKAIHGGRGQASLP